MTPKIYRNERWTNLDGSAPTYEELMELCVSHMRDFEKELEWRYSHCEIEATCGGELALEVREKVMLRRSKIRQEKNSILPEQRTSHENTPPDP